MRRSSRAGVAAETVAMDARVTESALIIVLKRFCCEGVIVEVEQVSEKTARQAG